MSEFGDYQLLWVVARGGMGIVYRARQKSLNRLVAVKLVLAGQLATPDSIQRFRLEAEAAARLQHPGIVPIYEIGEIETQHFFSMELIDGASLAECLGDFAIDEGADRAVQHHQELCIADLIARVARALDFAHQRGVLHRDLKPSNILIDTEGLPHLTDFGLAKLTGRETSGLTLSQAVLGTPGYLAPEQAAGESNVTIAADVYGLGATLYELLVRVPPFVGSSAIDTMMKAISDDPRPPRQLIASIHLDLETIVLRCLQKRPEHRYPSAAAVADELERFIRREPILARPIGSAERLWRWCQRHPGISSMACALVIAIILGTAATLSQWYRATQANVSLLANVEHLRWELIDEMLETGQASRAIAQVASIVRNNRNDWKAAMFGISILEQRRFPVSVIDPIRHPDGAEINVARLSPNGKWIATASYDGTACLWDAKTSELLFPPLQHGASVNWTEFSPNGDTLASASDDKSVRFWDPATGKPIGDPIMHAEAVLELSYSPDGNQLLTRTLHTVSVYSVVNRNRLLGPFHHSGRLVAAEFQLNGAVFSICEQAGDNSAVTVRDSFSGEPRFQLNPGNFTDADVSEDGSRVVTCSGESGYIWDTESGQRTQEFTSDNGKLLEVSFSPSGSRIGAIGLNHWARVWDTESGIPLTPELPHYYLLTGIRFLDNDRLLTWARDSLAQIWDANSGERLSQPMHHPYRVGYAEHGKIDGREVILTALSHGKSRANAVGSGAVHLWRIHETREPISRARVRQDFGHDGCRLSNDGKFIALGSTTQEVWIIETESGETVCGPLSVKGGPWGLLFTPDSKRLATLTSRGQVAIWDVSSGKLVFEPQQYATTFQPVAMATDGKRFAAGSTDGYLRLWETVTGDLLWEKQHGSEINSIAFSPDGQFLASAGEDRVVRIWQTHSGTLQNELTGHGNEVMRVSYSPDGNWIITASLDFIASIWDASDGRRRFVLPHQGEVLDAIYSPDGKYVATASRDRTAVIWNAMTGKPHQQALLHEQGVRNVRFSPDGTRLLTVDFRGPRVWDVETGHPLSVHFPQTIAGGTGFQSESMGPQITPNGQQVFLATDRMQALLWPVSVPPPDIPNWFPDFLEAVAGQKVVPGADVSEMVPSSRYLEIRQRLNGSDDTDYYTRWAKHWLSGY